MQDLTPGQPPTTMMTGYPAEPPDQAACACRQGNQLWLENLSDRSMSVAVTVGGATSGILPETASEPTILINTVPGSGGPLDLTVNGNNARLLENLDPALLTRPEDVQVGVLAGPRRDGLQPLDQGRGIPVMSEGNEADLSAFLSEGVTETNTEIDLIMVCEAATGPGAVGPGAHNVDDLSDQQLGWLSGSLAQNTVANTANEAGNVALFAREVGRGNRGQIVAALKEVILQGRFYVKSIASWGGKHAIIFKGVHRSRSFLTAIAYGLRNGKMSYVSSYADVMAAPTTGAGAGSAARSAAKGNFIGFAIAAAFDVNDFIKSEDPEKNWGDLLGALGVTFVKVWIAGFIGIIAAAAIASAAVAAGAAAVPVIVVVGIGVGISIAAGFLLDKLDNWLGVKDRARRIGRTFAGAVNRGLRAVEAFVEKIVTTGKGLIDSWFDEFQQSLRRNDPNGWCALFCSDPLDQVNAWQRALGGRGFSLPGH